MSATAATMKALRQVPVRDFVEDICLCQGPGERVKYGDLWLFVCVRCGKATHERGVRVGDAERRFDEERR